MKLRRARLNHGPRKAGPTVAVIDIGSNSVRLVVYEALTRSLVPFFNEKIMCGLGREVHSSGLLAADAVAKALSALKRFRSLCEVIGVGQVYVVATAACRDADNGPEFIAQAERILGAQIEILSGTREANLSAQGVVSGIHKPDGLAGDLGGGSLELIDISGRRVSRGVSLPLGGLALQDMSHRSIKRAEKIVKEKLADIATLKAARGRSFYAVGGTWRALTRLHISQTGYPLRVMHGYTIPAEAALAFARRVKRMASGRAVADIEAVADARRPLLVLCRAGARIHHPRIPKQMVVSTFGVREGLLFTQLPADEQRKDGLLAAARSQRAAFALAKAVRRAVRLDQPFREGDRHQRNSTGAAMAACGVPARRYGWRAHPDYRGEQSLNLIANGNFGSVDHEGRAFLGLTVFYRYAGLGDTHDELAPRIAELISDELVGWAQVIGTAIRVAASDFGGADRRARGHAFQAARQQTGAEFRAARGGARRRPHRQPRPTDKR